MPKPALLTAHGGAIELAEFPLPCPFSMGHEMVGGIAELGEGLTADATGKPLAAGDRVVAPHFGRLMPEPFHLAGVNAAFASAHAGLVPRGASAP